MKHPTHPEALEVRCPTCRAPPGAPCLVQDVETIVKPVREHVHGERLVLRAYAGAGSESGAIRPDTCLECGDTWGTNAACKGCELRAMWLRQHKDRGAP